MYINKDDKNYESFLDEIKTLAGKIPLFCEIYKINNFIDYEKCKVINLFYIYNQNRVTFNDTEYIRKELAKILSDKIKLNINLTLNVLYCSKQIKSINYFNLFIDNQNMKDELNKTKEKLNKTNDELNEIKKFINNLCIKNNIQLPENLFSKFNEFNDSNKSQEEKKLISLNEDEEENKKSEKLNDTEKIIYNNFIKDKEFKKIIKEEKNESSIYNSLKEEIKKKKYKKYDLNVKNKLMGFLKAKLNKK